MASFVCGRDFRTEPSRASMIAEPEFQTGREINWRHFETICFVRDGVEPISAVPSIRVSSRHGQFSEQVSVCRFVFFTRGLGQPLTEDLLVDEQMKMVLGLVIRRVGSLEKGFGGVAWENTKISTELVSINEFKNLLSKGWFRSSKPLHIQVPGFRRSRDVKNVDWLIKKLADFSFAEDEIAKKSSWCCISCFWAADPTKADREMPLNSPAWVKEMSKRSLEILSIILSK